MSRTLSAIEIAEGALLADIAVIFQLLSLYIPFVGGIFRLLIPVVFSILVLRRRLAVGIMSLCVAIFITGMLTGPNLIFILFLEGSAGLYLGLVMKYRVHHFAILILGVTSAACCIYAFFLITTFALGFSIHTLLLSIHQAYTTAMLILGKFALNLGVEGAWTQSISPFIVHVADLGFTYWWLAIYIGGWIFLWPAVIVVYTLTNSLVRLLGYDVQPFPGGIIEKSRRKIVKIFIKQGIRRGIVHRHA